MHRYIPKRVTLHRPHIKKMYTVIRCLLRPENTHATSLMFYYVTWEVAPRPQSRRYTTGKSLRHWQPAGISAWLLRTFHHCLTFLPCPSLVAPTPACLTASSLPRLAAKYELPLSGPCVVSASPRHYVFDKRFEGHAAAFALPRRSHSYCGLYLSFIIFFHTHMKGKRKSYLSSPYSTHGRGHSVPPVPRVPCFKATNLSFLSADVSRAATPPRHYHPMCTTTLPHCLASHR